MTANKATPEELVPMHDRLRSIADSMDLQDAYFIEWDDAQKLREAADLIESLQKKQDGSI